MLRFVVISLAIAALAACGNDAPPAAPSAADAQTATVGAPAVTPPWFICDAIDAPSLYLFTREGNVAHVTEYARPSGASMGVTDYQISEREDAAGSFYTPLTRNGADDGFVREINIGNIETPGSAYTQLMDAIKLGDREIRCRWLPRTRVAAFTGRRSFVISEDADGDLIYTAFDFARAPSAQPIELSENGRSTAFSVEVRGGHENVRPDGADFTFAARDGYTYHVGVANTWTGQLQVERDGAVIQTEPLAAFIVGQAGED